MSLGRGKKLETGLQGKRSGDGRQKEKEVKDPLLLPMAKRRDTQVEKREGEKRMAVTQKRRKKWQNGSSKEEEEEKKSKPSLTPD